MHKPERKAFPLPVQSASSWNEVLSNPRDIAIVIIKTGHLHISNMLFLNMKHPNARGLKKEKMDVPVYCYLIRHLIEGAYLVDAGLDKSFQKNTHGKFSRPFT